MKQTSYEREHGIDPDVEVESRTDAIKETPEEKQERIDRDVAAGLRAPPPETIDQTKSTVTGDQVAEMAAAAPQPHRGVVEGKGLAGSGSGNSTPVQDLEDHTVEELRSIAAQEGAELHGASVKADIIKAIKKNRKQQ